MSHDEYRGALVRRAALAELALDLFEDCDALASLPAPGAAPERLDVHGDPSFCTLWTLLGFPALTLLPACPTAASRTECNSPANGRGRSALARRELVRSGDRFQRFSRVNCGNAFALGLARWRRLAFSATLRGSGAAPR